MGIFSQVQNQTNPQIYSQSSNQYIQDVEDSSGIRSTSGDIWPGFMEEKPVEYGEVLTADQARLVLHIAGWPDEIIPQALQVWHGESGNCFCTHKIGDGGAALGAFQMHWYETWFAYALTAGYVQESDRDSWQDPFVNARVALATYYYDINRGQPAWTQWSVKPSY